MLQHILWLLLKMKQEDTAYLEIHPLFSHLPFKVDSDGIQGNGLSIHLISHSVLTCFKIFPKETISVGLHYSLEPVSNQRNENKGYENNSARVCTRPSELVFIKTDAKRYAIYITNINISGESACNWTNVNLTHAAIW